MTELTHNRSYERLKIYINGVLHLQLKLLDMVGFQSWIHGENEFFIEYYFSTRDKITTVYGDRDLWQKVLTLLDKHLNS